MDFLYQFISENLIYALGWTVLHSLWQGLIIGLLMAFAMFYLKNRAAKVRYEVAAFSQFMVFIAALSTFLIYYDGGLQLDSFAQLSPLELQQLAAIAQEGMLTQSLLQSCVSFFNNHIPVVVSVWLFGATFFIVRMLGGLFYVQHLRYHKTKAVPEYWNSRLKSLKSRIRLNQKVKLLESAAASVPMVIGCIKPVILLPIGAINKLNSNEVEAILAHELAHIQRNDYLINIVLTIIEVLFYFNPAVWWIAANVRTERENCCDDVAVKLCGSSLTYAKALVSLQEIGRSAPSMAMTFSGPKNQLLHRVKRILNQPQNKSNIMEKMTATLLLLLTVVLFSIGANSNYDYTAHTTEGAATQVVAESTAIHKQTPKPVQIESLKISPIPEPERIIERKRYINKTDDGTVEIEIEESSIVKLSIDGRNIPSSAFGKYHYLIDDLLADLDMLPGASGNNVNNGSIASVPNFQHKKTITKSKDGKTHIYIQNGNQMSTEVVINADNKYIIIDGNRFGDGDTAVIVERRSIPQLNKTQHNVHQQAPALVYKNESFTWKERSELERQLAEIDASKKRWEAAYNSRWQQLEKRWKKLDQLNEKLWKKQAQVNAPELRKKQELINLQINELVQKKQRWTAAKKKWYEEHHKEKDQIIRKLSRQQRQTSNCCKGCNKNKSKSSSNSIAQTPDDNLSSSIAEVPLQLNNDGFLKFNNQIKHQLENEMLEDFLIHSKDDYSFELNNRRLKINGHKQGKSIFKKYLELYEELTGLKMTARSQIVIQNRDGNANTNYHSSDFKDMERVESYSWINQGDGTWYITTPDSSDLSGDIILAAVEFQQDFEFDIDLRQYDSAQPFTFHFKEISNN